MYKAHLRHLSSYITFISIVICCTTALKQQKIVKSAIEIDILVASHIYSVLCYWVGGTTPAIA